MIITYLRVFTKLAKFTSINLYCMIENV